MKCIYKTVPHHILKYNARVEDSKKSTQENLKVSDKNQNESAS
jgi:hypothetical protein